MYNIKKDPKTGNSELELSFDNHTKDDYSVNISSENNIDYINIKSLIDNSIEFKLKSDERIKNIELSEVNNNILIIVSHL